MKRELKFFIKDRQVDFDYFRNGIAFYRIETEDGTFGFPVPLNDIGDATLLKQDKAIFFMRWIRKALEREELVHLPG
jgi:hypothetical protein